MILNKTFKEKTNKRVFEDENNNLFEVDFASCDDNDYRRGSGDLASSRCGIETVY